MNTYIKDIKKLLLSLQKEDVVYTMPIPDVMKFKVNGDIELSRVIRKELVRLGLPNTDKDILHDKALYLFAYTKDDRNQITRSDSEKHYNEHRGIETTLEELKLMEKENE